MGVRHTETSLIIWSGKAASEKKNDKKMETAAPLFGANEYYDAGDKGCAVGPLDEIAAIIQKLQPGQTLEVHATDQTVSVDLSAWCRMTGHQLLKQEGSHYLLQHK